MDTGILIWVLVGAVLISLGLSVVALILQIRRNSPGKQKQDKQVRTNPQGYPPAPPPQSNQPQIPIAQGEWRPPVWRNEDDYADHTEALFSYAQPPNRAPAGAAGQLQSDTWQIYIREKGPSGERSYEVMVRGEFPIGRSAQNGLLIDNSTVSGLQCVLIAGLDNVFISNRSSSNITRLNGAMVTDTRPLKPGDTISIGNIQLAMLDIRKAPVR